MEWSIGEESRRSANATTALLSIPHSTCALFISFFFSLSLYLKLSLVDTFLSSIPHSIYLILACPLLPFLSSFLLLSLYLSLSIFRLSMTLFSSLPSSFFFSSKASRHAESAPATRHGSSTSTFAHTHMHTQSESGKGEVGGDVKRSSVTKMMSSLIKKLNFGSSSVSAEPHSQGKESQGPGSTADSSAAVSRGDEG